MKLNDFLFDEKILRSGTHLKHKINQNNEDKQGEKKG